ncbi:MAG: DeoR/GlpR family DNA-binding transcription regulator, partial [Oscillospiraceae bacterium]
MTKQNQVQLRHKKILQLLEQNQEATLPYLCKALDCSETTIRNDLRTLEQHGMLRRTFGGAIRADDTPYLWLNINVRAKAHASEKYDIARFAVENFIKPNMTIVLDAGTTCAVLAQEIAKRR